MRSLHVLALIGVLGCVESVEPREPGELPKEPTPPPPNSPPPPRLALAFGQMTWESGEVAAGVLIHSGDLRGDSVAWTAGITRADSAGRYRLFHQAYFREDTARFVVGVEPDENVRPRRYQWLTPSPLVVRTSEYDWPLRAHDSVEFNGVIPGPRP